MKFYATYPEKDKDLFPNKWTSKTTEEPVNPGSPGKLPLKWRYIDNTIKSSSDNPSSGMSHHEKPIKMAVLASVTNTTTNYLQTGFMKIKIHSSI